MNTVQTVEAVTGIALSTLAVEQVKQFMARENIAVDTAGLRVSATPGGCSGFRYWLNVEDQPLPGDLVVEQDGLRVFMDSASATHLAGAEIDFVSTVDAAGFKVNNPNEPDTCSCDCGDQCPA